MTPTEKVIDKTDTNNRTSTVNFSQNDQGEKTRSSRPRGRIFPEYTMTPERLAKRRTEKLIRCQKSRVIFEQIRPQLISDYNNWFIAIEPDSGNYFIAENEEQAVAQARHQYPQGWLVTFKINETGTCGLI